MPGLLRSAAHGAWSLQRMEENVMRIDVRIQVTRTKGKGCGPSVAISSEEWQTRCVIRPREEVRRVVSSIDGWECAHGFARGLELAGHEVQLYYTKGSSSRVLQIFSDALCLLTPEYVFFGLAYGLHEWEHIVQRLMGMFPNDPVMRHRVLAASGTYALQTHLRRATLVLP